MLGVSFWEIIIILIVALVVVGPDKLPKVAYKAGVWLRYVQKMLSKVKEEVEQELEKESLHKLATKVSEKTKAAKLSLTSLDSDT